jgi:hypothetical protein
VENPSKEGRKRGKEGLNEGFFKGKGRGCWKIFVIL